MNENHATVKLTLGQTELLLTKKLCGKNGAVLSDRRELSDGNSVVLVFSKFYKRFASLYGLTVVVRPCDGVCRVSWTASCGKKDMPLLGDMGAAKDFCGEVEKALEPYVLE